MASSFGYLPGKMSQVSGAKLEAQRKLRREVEELQVQNKYQRTRLSNTLRELIDYCQQNVEEDALVYPRKENPFKEKRSCLIL